MVALAPSGNRTSVTLPTDEQILIRREFDVPRALVYRAWTTPELVRRWWTAKRGQATVAEIDLRVGGRWRYVMVTDDGIEVGFHGCYREIVPDTRIVSTEVFEGRPQGQRGGRNHAQHRDLRGVRRPHHAHDPRRGDEPGRARRHRGLGHGVGTAGRDGSARGGRALTRLSAAGPAGRAPLRRVKGPPWMQSRAPVRGVPTL